LRLFEGCDDEETPDGGRRYRSGRGAVGLGGLPGPGGGGDRRRSDRHRGDDSGLHRLRPLWGPCRGPGPAAGPHPGSAVLRSAGSAGVDQAPLAVPLFVRSPNSPPGPIKLHPSLRACSTSRRASSSLTTGPIAGSTPALSVSATGSTAGNIESVTACPFGPDPTRGQPLRPSHFHRGCDTPIGVSYFDLKNRW